MFILPLFLLTFVLYSIYFLQYPTEVQYMIVVLLIIIACVLLFGADATKSGLSTIFFGFLVLVIIASMLTMCGAS